VGAVSGGFRPTEFDVSQMFSPGAESEILIRVEAAPGSAQSGLVGTVWLEGRPRTYVSGLEFRALPNGDSWTLEARVALSGTNGTVDVSVNSSEPDVGEGRTTVTLNAGSGEALLRLPITNAQL